VHVGVRGGGGVVRGARGVVGWWKADSVGMFLHVPQDSSYLSPFVEVDTVIELDTEHDTVRMASCTAWPSQVGSNPSIFRSCLHKC
jgi:hypothetical protein